MRRHFDRLFRYSHNSLRQPWFRHEALVRPAHQLGTIRHASSVYSKAGRNAPFISRVLDLLDHVVTFYWYLPREYFPHMTKLRAKIGYNASRLDVMDPINMPMLGRRWANVGPTICQPLVRRWANVPMSTCPNIGPMLGA